MPIVVYIRGERVELTLAEARTMQNELKRAINQTTDFEPETVLPLNVNNDGRFGRDALFKFFDQYYEAQRRDRRAGAVFSYLLSRNLVKIYCSKCGQGSHQHNCNRPFAFNGIAINRRFAMVDVRSILENRAHVMASISGRKEQLRHDMTLLLDHLSM